MWVGRDSNPRSPKTRDLQSRAFDRSATYPEPAEGFGPPTDGLQNRCSTPELRWLKLFL